MSDLTALSPAAPSAPARSALLGDLLHYVAGGALLALSAWAAQQNLLDHQVLATLIVGAALGIGFKLKG